MRVPRLTKNHPETNISSALVFPGIEPSGSCDIPTIILLRRLSHRTLPDQWFKGCDMIFHLATLRRGDLFYSQSRFNSLQQEDQVYVILLHDDVELPEKPSATPNELRSYHLRLANPLVQLLPSIVFSNHGEAHDLPLPGKKCFPSQKQLDEDILLPKLLAYLELPSLQEDLGMLDDLPTRPSNMDGTPSIVHACNALSSKNSNFQNIYSYNYSSSCRIDTFCLEHLRVLK